MFWNVCSIYLTQQSILCRRLRSVDCFQTRMSTDGMSVQRLEQLKNELNDQTRLMLMFIATMKSLFNPKAYFQYS
jgi:hypothetical protein